MNCFHALLYTLVIAIWMQVRITNGTSSSNVASNSPSTASSDSISVGATTSAAISTNNASATASLVSAMVQASSAVVSINVATTSVAVQASSTSGIQSVATTSVASQASHNVTIVAVQASNTSGIRSVATTSVAARASHDVTSVSVQASSTSGIQSVATTSVAAQASHDVTSVSVQASSTSVSVQASSTSVAVQASHNVTRHSVAPTSVAVSGSVPSSAVATNIPSTTGSNLTSVTVQASDITSSVMSSYMSLYPSANSTPSVNGSMSPRATPAIGSSAYSNKTFQPSQQVSTIPSSFTSMESSHSAAILATSFVLQATVTLSVSGQTSKTTRLPSSNVIIQSPNASQSTQVESSMLVHSSSKGMSSIMTHHLVGSLTVAVSNSTSTSSPPIDATSSSQDTTPSTSIAKPFPTLPPEGTKLVNMEVSFDLTFEEEYNNPSSPEYKELEKNLTTALVEVYKTVEGFVGIRIVLISEGSVVCNYIVILAKDAKVEKSKLKEILEKASEGGNLPFKVKSIKVTEDESKETVEKLPGWAKATMIVLGCLCAVFMIIVIYVCVQYRKSLYGDSDAYMVSSGELGLGHTYETMGDNKIPANQGYSKTSAPERRVIGSHSNPAYGANGAFAD